MCHHTLSIFSSGIILSLIFPRKKIGLGWEGEGGRAHQAYFNQYHHNDHLLMLVLMDFFFSQEK